MGNKNAIRRYLWINPVVEAMAGSGYEEVLRQVKACGFIPVTCSTGADRVLRQYREALERKKENILIDSRCPMIVDWIQQHYPELRGCQADILPILLTCAVELYQQYIEAAPQAASLTLATPCSALAHQGNEKLGRLAKFVTWKQFCEEQGLDFALIRACGSPIPPGFFQFADFRIWEANGADGVATMLEKFSKTNETPDLLELLYCEGGCHNGDGV